MKKINLKNFAKSFLPPLIAGGIGAIIVALDYVNYDNLILPDLHPPKFIFPIAWTIVYACSIVATYIFLQKEDNLERYQKGIINFYVNMFINLMWTVAFFGLGNLLLGLIVIIALYISTLLVYLSYRKTSKVSANLIIPYLAWLLVATYLNICIVFLN